MLSCTLNGFQRMFTIFTGIKPPAYSSVVQNLLVRTCTSTTAPSTIALVAENYANHDVLEALNPELTYKQTYYSLKKGSGSGTFSMCFVQIQQPIKMNRLLCPCKREPQHWQQCEPSIPHIGKKTLPISW